MFLIGIGKCMVTVIYKFIENKWEIMDATRELRKLND